MHANEFDTLVQETQKHLTDLLGKHLLMETGCDLATQVYDKESGEPLVKLDIVQTPVYTKQLHEIPSMEWFEQCIRTHMFCDLTHWLNTCNCTNFFLPEVFIERQMNEVKMLCMIAVDKEYTPD